MYLDTTIFELPLVRLGLGLLVGLLMGSFTTMLSYRVPRKLSIVTPPSQCPHCHTPLSKRDLVPVLSWLLWKGRCRHCKNKIGIRYLVIELVTTFLIVAAFLIIGIEPALLVAIAAIVALVTKVTINLEQR